MSTVIGGLVSDRFEKKNKMTKAYVCIFGTLLSLPAIGLCTLTGHSFYLALVCMGLKYFLAEGWMSPSITMMQATVKPEEQGSIVSAWLFYNTLVGCFSTILLGAVANALGAPSNPMIYGYLIFGWNLIGKLGSIPFFLRGGREYKKHMEN